MEQTKRIFQNKTTVLEIDLFGGAITDFHLCQCKVNPLSFRFSKEQMPLNNQAGAPYQGHFLCLGRWGEPSAGEIKAGLPDHGQIANMMWEAAEQRQHELKMHATSSLEGLHIDRTIRMDIHHPVYLVKETVSNINPLGRLYNMVQHPTLAMPFLSHATTIDCNAAEGFNYLSYEQPEKNASHWPEGITEDQSIVNLGSSLNGVNSVFSFIVSRKDDLGWVTAYSPKDQLLFGYVWKRKDYSWINLWQDWDSDRIRYRGLEFGTTGIHKPFRQILEDGNSRVFGENTLTYIDAGEKQTRSYLSFLYKVQSGFKAVDSVSVKNDQIKIRARMDDRTIFLNIIPEDSDLLQVFLQH